MADAAGDTGTAGGTDTSNTDGKTNSGTTSTAGDESASITMTSQQLSDRLARAKPADYDDLKAKAAKLDKIEQANKSEIEKSTEKVAAAERERDAAKAEALRLRVAAKHQITDEDADLFLTGTDEETLTRQAQRLTQRSEDRKKNGTVVTGEGRNVNQSKPDDRKAFADFLTGHTS